MSTRGYYVREHWRDKGSSAQWLPGETPQEAALEYARWRVPVVPMGEARFEVYYVSESAHGELDEVVEVRVRFEYRLAIEVTR